MLELATPYGEDDTVLVLFPPHRFLLSTSFGYWEISRSTMTSLRSTSWRSGSPPT
jgi:hypothetical protein